MTRRGNHGIGLLLRLLLVAGVVLGSIFLVSSGATAAVTVTPSTWNVIGLDSNSPATGPYRFPVGAKVCGGTPGTSTTATFTWDSANAYVDLRSGSAGASDGPPLSITFGADGCADAFFEVEVTRTALAFGTSRRYHITADGVSTPRPRELFVERLISQNRNAVTGVRLNGSPIPAGGAMNLMVGNTYTITLHGGTATQGYNQFEAFINFPNTIFQIQSVSTTYSADDSPYVPAPNPGLYADACRWENDPNSPYYRSCYDDYKAGGSNVVTTYVVKIIGGGGSSETLNTLLYDFSGSSFHYNADYAAGARIANITGPSSVTITKSFTPKTISPNGISALTIKLTNPTVETLTGVNFIDNFPADMSVAGSPGVSYSGCGAGAFSPAPAGGETSLSFGNATLLPNSSCIATINVTAPAGTYPNTTGNLFINSSVNTGNTGSDTLVAAFTPACVSGQTAARWTVPATATNPPDQAGGLPTTIGPDVSSATASFSSTNGGVSAITSARGSNDTYSWRTYGWKTAGSEILFKVDTSSYSGSSITFWAARDATAGPNTLSVAYSTNNGSSYSTPDNFNITSTFQQISVNIPSNNQVWVRLTASGANNNNQGADLFIDDISFTGCRLAPPPPTLTKAFSPASIVKGGTSDLSFTLGNTASGNKALTGVAFTDELPPGISVANASVSRCGGTLTTTAATRMIALTGGTLAAGESCGFTVTTTGAAAGVFQNITGNITAAESGTNTTASGYATANLTVIAPPALAKSYSPASIFTSSPGDTATLTFEIVNPNAAIALSGIGFTDTLPAGLTVATSGPTVTCGGTLATTSPGSISFSGGALAADSSCSFEVTVTGTSAGTKSSTTTAVTSVEGGNGNTAAASLVVSDRNPSIDLTKQVSTSASGPWSSYVAVAAGSDVYYRFKVYNSGDVPLYDVGITETAGTISPVCSWPEPLAAGETAYCVSSAATAAAGSHVNTAYAHARYPSGGPVYNSASSSATYATTGVTVAKSAAETYFTRVDDILHYSYLVTNSGSATLAGPVTVTDDKVGTVSCDLTGAGDGDNYFDPAESVSCGPAAYTVTEADVTAKQVTNVASASTTAYGLIPAVTSATTSLTVPFGPDLTATKANDVGGIHTPGSSFAWTITVANAAAAGAPAAFADGQLLLTDDLPNSGATYAVPATATNSAGTTGTIDCAIAADTLTCTANGAVSIPPGESFSIAVTVTSTAPGSLVNPRSGGICRADPGALVAESDEANNDCADTVTVGTPSLTILKSVQPRWDPVNDTVNPKPIPGALVLYSILVTNTGYGPTDADTLSITDRIPAGTELFVGDIDGVGSGPVLFTNGATPSGLTYSFISLDNPGDSLAFSDDGGATYDKADTAPDGNQCDPTVTHLKVSLRGALGASDGTNHPSFTLSFWGRIE